MAIKEWFRKFRPVQLYIMLFLTVIFFITQLVMSHMTHALTLLVDSFHMLCNLIALSGCIITIRKSAVNLAVHDKTKYDEADESSGDEINKMSVINHQTPPGCTRAHQMPSVRERRLRNTFGWARIDVLVMLICCVFLASLCFSVTVEALQTLVHIDHHDEMHHPIPVMCVGAVGILLNGVCYLMIGGYTFHQGSFLHVTESGDVVLDHNVSKDSVRRGQRRLSKQSRQPEQIQATPRQGTREMCRDVIGCLFVIVCSIIVYYTDQSVAKYVDPVMAIISAALLFALSIPYMKESGLILLQTIPDHIDINVIREKLLKEFTDIINVHELHVWQLTSSKVFATAHIIFLNPKDYTRITNNITDFFYEQGITQVTIQPEFFKADNGSSLTPLPLIEDNKCLVPCPGELCHDQTCCSSNNPDLLSVSIGHGHSHGHSHTSSSHGHSHTDTKHSHSHVDTKHSHTDTEQSHLETKHRHSIADTKHSHSHTDTEQSHLETSHRHSFADTKPVHSQLEHSPMGSTHDRVDTKNSHSHLQPAHSLAEPTHSHLEEAKCLETELKEKQTVNDFVLISEQDKDIKVSSVVET